MARRISAAFNAAAAQRLHPCVWDEGNMSAGYWECHKTAMTKKEATEWILNKFPRGNGDRPSRFVHPYDAWSPSYWSLNPFGWYSWTDF